MVHDLHLEWYQTNSSLVRSEACREVYSKILLLITIFNIIKFIVNFRTLQFLVVPVFLWYLIIPWKRNLALYSIKIGLELKAKSLLQSPLMTVLSKSGK